MHRSINIDNFENARANLFPEVSIQPKTREAFLRVPRIDFINRFKVLGNSSWVSCCHADIAYNIINSDRSLMIAGENTVISTASQPSLIWLMLDLLCVESGMVVYEFGTGSGWSTALTAQLVGHNGAVYSSEIEESLAHEAAVRIARLDLQQVTIKCTAGDFDWAGRDADRIIYTTSAASPHDSSLKRASPQCKAVFVFQCIGLADAIVSANREGNSYVSEKIVPCYFLPMRAHSGEPAVEASKVGAPSSYRTIDWDAPKPFLVTDFAHWLNVNWSSLPASNSLTLRQERYRSLILARANSACLKLSSDCIEAECDFDEVEIVESWLRRWVADGAPSVLDYRLTISKPPRGAPLPRHTELRNDWHFSWTRVN